MLNTTRFIALTSLAAVMALAPIAKADEWNKRTILTVKETIQLPNTWIRREDGVRSVSRSLFGAGLRTF